MSFKRSILNYIVWGLLCVVMFAGIGVSAIGASEAASNPAYLIYVGIFYAIFIVGIVAILILYKGLKKPLSEKFDFSTIKLDGILEIVFVFVAAILSLIVRFSVAITKFMEFGGDGVFLGTNAYYDYATGTISNLGTGENGAYIFVGILKILFSIFGQGMVVVYVFQAILSLGIALFLFSAIRKSLGRIPAWICLLLISFLPASINMFLYCTPGLLFGFLLSGYFFASVMLIQFFLGEKADQNKYLVLHGLLGVFAGFIAYFDISGLILFPLTIYAFYQFKKPESHDKYDHPKWQSLTFAGCGLGFLILALFAFPAGISAGFSGIARYFMMFVPREGINISILTPFYGTWESAIVYMLAGFWLLEFVKTGKDRAFPFAVLAIFFVLFHFLTLDHVSYEAAFSIAVTIIGAIGLRYMNILFLPMEAESDDALKERMIEIENKRKEKENKKFAKRIEKENKSASRHKTSVITLGKIEHTEEAGETADVSGETPVADNAEAKTAENETAVSVNNAEESIGNEAGTGAAGQDGKTESEAKETAQSENSGNEAAEIAQSEKTENEAVETAQTEAASTETAQAAPTEITEAETVQTAPTETTEADAAQTGHEENATVGSELTQAAGEGKETEEVSATESKPEETASEPVVSEEKPAELNATETEIKAETTAEITAETEPAKPVKKELPPYVPQKMVMKGRRGKMFAPIKKAEVEFESNPEYLNKPLIKETTTDDISTTKEAVAVAAAVTVAGVAAQVASEATGETSAAPVTEAVNATVETAAAEVVNEAVETVATETVSEAVETVAAETVGEAVETVATETVSETVETAATETVSETVETVTAETVIETVETAAAETVSEPVETVAAEAASETEKAAETETKKEDSKNTDSDNHMIKNVLPGPKPHVPKELAFDYDPTEDEMDFDIKDLTGKDFYDV